MKFTGKSETLQLSKKEFLNNILKLKIFSTKNFLKKSRGNHKYYSKKLSVHIKL